MAVNMSTSHRILANPLLTQKVEGSDLILQWKLYSNHFHSDMWIQLD